MRISFDANDNLVTILRRVRDAVEAEIELEIPPASSFWQGPVNRALLVKVAEENGKSVHFRDGKLDADTKTHAPEVEQDNRAQVTPDGLSVLPRHSSAKKDKRPGKGKLFLGLILLVVVLVVGAVVGGYYYLPKSEIKLVVAKKTLEEETQVKIDPQANRVDSEAKVLPGRKIQVEESAQKDFAATGTQTVGEKALGEVTLRNWTNAELTIAKGTMLTVDEGQTGAGLRFVTDNTVQVPPQSLDNTQGVRRAGTMNVAVTAEKFGQEYNLPANLDFVVDQRSFDQLSAINKSAFSGGTTEQVTVVTQADLDNAQEQLKAELFAKGEEDLMKKITPEEKIARETINHATAFAEFSQEVGAQADNFTLTMRTVSQAVSYHQNQLRKLLEELLRESVPEGFKLSTDDIAVTVKEIKRGDDGSLLAVGVIKGLVIPSIDLEELRQRLVGVQLNQAEQILKATPLVEEFEVKLWPRLPAFLAALPRRVERITIKLEVK